jgi:hypothetical protein
MCPTLRESMFRAKPLHSTVAAISKVRLNTAMVASLIRPDLLEAGGGNNLKRRVAIAAVVQRFSSQYFSSPVLPSRQRMIEFGPHGGCDFFIATGRSDERLQIWRRIVVVHRRSVSKRGFI